MRILSGGFLVLLTACASAPTEQAAAPVATVAAAPGAHPASAAGATSAAPVAATAVQAAADTDEPAVAKAKAGYSLSKQNGEVVYCRRETPTGSRRPVHTCYTPEQLEAIEQSTREAQDAMDRQRNSSGCGKFCGAGG